MKYLKYIFAITLIISLASCKKDRYPEFENSANAQFTRKLGAVITSTTNSYASFDLKKTTPDLADEFLLNVVESGNVKSVSVMVDYRKTGTTAVVTQKFADIATWPQTYNASLNSLVALFASNGVTLANLTVNDRFVFRLVITLNSGTIVSEQSSLLNTVPYAVTLTYTVKAS